MPKSQSVCSTCHKPLEQSKCYQCNGKGYTRVLLFFEKDCPSCQGRGWILRCPDEYQHAMDRIRQISQTTSRLTPNNKFRPLTPPNLNKPQVPPPWWNRQNPLSPTNPNSPYNPNNPNSPLNPHNPNNPNNPNSPLNINSPRHPLNPNNPINKNPFKK